MNANQDKNKTENEIDSLVDLENVEIQPLSDEDLESVVGFCSGWCCSNG